MKSALQLIEELNTLDEHASIEAKTSSESGESLMETVCAFANEPGLGGGYLILGVAPASDSFWPVYEVVGVPDPGKLQSDIASQCASMFNTVVRPKISVESIDGKNVVVVFVSEAGPHEKPVYFKNKQLPKSARRRIGSTDQKCTEDDLVIFYRGRDGKTYDEQIMSNARLDDLDDEAVDYYRLLRKEVNPDAEELKWQRNELLEALGAVERESGDLKPTVAGVLLFGKPAALRRLFPMMRIDYIRIAGTEWIEDPDRRFDTVEIRSPLIRAIQRARSAIMDDLPKAFSLPAGEIQGKEIPQLPDRVVREVVANAAMHRDYRVHGSIQIIRYSNRLEVLNPGFSIKNEERLDEPGSEARNPKIAAVLHDVKLAETKGSGIRVMRDLMEDRHLSAPRLKSDRIGNSFSATLLFHHFLTQEDLDWLQGFGDVGLSEDEMKAMISAREAGSIENRTYRELNRDCDTLAASKHLRRLCDLGLLEKKGQAANTYYEPTRRAMSNWPPRAAGSVESGKFDTKSGKLESKSGKLAAGSGKLGLPDAAGQTGELEAGNAPPPDLQAILDHLGGKLQARNTAVDAIIQLLEWKELSAAEIANFLNRSVDHVREHYITPMVMADLIRPTMPDSPKHPRQKYTVTRPKRKP
jgi:ATP-dependent DNA helicase RecG